MTSPADQPQRILDGLRRYAASQSEVGRDFAREMGMHVTDSAAVVEILRAEQREQPLTPARLAERIGLSSGATSILLNRLEDAGHITRRREHVDRRLVTLRSNRSVHTAAENFFAPRLAGMVDMLDRYSSDELDLVERFVSDLLATVDGPASSDPAREPTGG